MSDAGQNDAVRAADDFRIAGDARFVSDMVQRLLHRSEVARAIVDDGDHSRPFVLGSIFAIRRSRQQATRSARANVQCLTPNTEPGRFSSVNRVGRALRARLSRGKAPNRARSARSTDWFPSAPLKVAFDCIVPAKLS